MKPYLPYNAVLAAALAVLALTLFYNLAMRDSFSVTVRYTMPAAPRPQENVIAVEPNADADDSDYEREYGYEEHDYSWRYDSGESQLLSVTFPLELNSATEAELRFIPQVGDVTAQRIIQYRDVLGGYSRLEQLMEIKGIGDTSFENIAKYLYLDGQDGDPAGETEPREDSAEE